MGHCGRVLLGHRFSLLALVLAVALALVPGTTNRADAATTATLTLSAPAQYADQLAPLVVTLVAGDPATPVAGAVVTVERWDGSAWQPVPGSPLATGVDGTARIDLVVDRQPDRNRVRASTGDLVRDHVLPVRAIATTTTLSGPAAVIDEQRITLRVERRTATDTAVPGSVVLQRWVDGAWHTVSTRATNEQGTVDIVLQPRVDSRYRAIGVGSVWAERSVSATHVIDNRPSGVPVRLPAGAPLPRVRLPAQARPTAPGAQAVITRIPDRVWRSMVGRSWHRGCPVGRSGLRLLRINYWDYQGYRRRGELVAAVGAVRQMAGALTDMHDARLPIRSMYRVDRFGWSKRLQGANDYRSMAAGNTSAFNCRWVVGRRGVRSPHTYGRSLDVNTWENPFRSSHGWVPNGWWPARSDPRIAWRSTRHRVVRIMARHGLRWTYGRSDSQHFDAVVRHGRVAVVPDCGQPVCH